MSAITLQRGNKKPLSDKDRAALAEFQKYLDTIPNINPVAKRTAMRVEESVIRNGPGYAQIVADSITKFNDEI